MPTEAEIAAVRDFVKNLNGLVKSVRLYGVEHERVTSQLNLAWAKLQTVLSDQPTFTLGASGTNLQLDNVPLGSTAVEQGLADLLSKGGVQTLHFASHVTVEEFTRFVKALGAPGKGTAIITRLLQELGESSQAGIKVNESQGGGGGAAGAAAAQPLLNVALLLQALTDPGKLKEVLDPMLGSPRSPGENLPLLPERELVRTLQVMGMFAQSQREPEKAEEIEKHMAGLSPSAKILLNESLSSMAGRSESERGGRSVMEQLSVDLILQFAMESFRRGQLNAGKLGEVFSRLGTELSQHVPEAAKLAEGVTVQEKLDADFWRAAPEDLKRKALLSGEAWVVPTDEIKKLVNQLLEAGDNMPAAEMLLNYAKCVESPSPMTRRRAVVGLRQMANLYASSFSEVIEGAFEHLGNQLGNESDGELKKLLTDAFLQINTAAAALLKPTPGSIKIHCMTCQQEEAKLLAIGPRADTEKIHEMIFYCLKCGDATLWTSAEPERRSTEGPQSAEAEQRSGEDRRQMRRVKMELPIRVRSEAPGQDFTIIGDTVNISRNGVLFHCERLMPVGLHVMVLMPYDPNQDLPETKARVVRVQDHEEGGHKIALHFERPGS